MFKTVLSSSLVCVCVEYVSRGPVKKPRHPDHAMATAVPTVRESKKDLISLESERRRQDLVLRPHSPAV